MKVFRKFILSVITLIVILLFIITLVFIINKKENKVPYILGYSAFINTGTSMLPTIQVGDLIIIKKEAEYKKDDIITFIKDEIITTHKIIEVDNDYYKTMGNNNSFIDGEDISQNNVYGKVIFIFHNFGVLFNFIYEYKYIILISIVGISFIVLGVHEAKKHVR